MASPSRDRVTIDLRGLGEAVRGAAAARGMGVAQFARQALVECLDQRSPTPAMWGSDGQTPNKTIVKMTLRLAEAHAAALMHGASALGLSYGDYVARLVSGSRLPQPHAERTADRAALLAASDQLATLSTDLNAVVRLLAANRRPEAEPYRARFLAADAEVKQQLDRMAKFLDAC